MQLLRFLQTTTRPEPVVLFGILSPAGSRRAAATLLEDCERERTILDQIFESLLEAGHPITHWYYGHFHQSWSATINGILFSMLDIMEFKELR